jgi:hypothetical protein
MLIEIAVGVCGFLMLFIYRAEAEDVLKGGMLKAIQSYGKDESVTKAWDHTQQEVCIFSIIGFFFLFFLQGSFHPGIPNRFSSSRPT